MILESDRKCVKRSIEQYFCKIFTTEKSYCTIKSCTVYQVKEKERKQIEHELDYGVRKRGSNGQSQEICLATDHPINVRSKQDRSQANWTNCYQMGPECNLHSAVQVHTTTHNRFLREQQLSPAPHKACPDSKHRSLTAAENCLLRRSVILSKVVSNTYYVIFVFLLRLVYPVLPVSLACPFVSAPSVFPNVYSTYCVCKYHPLYRFKSKTKILTCHNRSDKM